MGSMSGIPVVLSECCSVVRIIPSASATGRFLLSGQYSRADANSVFTCTGSCSIRSDTNVSDTYLHLGVVDVEHLGGSRWIFSRAGRTTLHYSIFAAEAARCPNDVQHWRFWDGRQYIARDIARVHCVDEPRPPPFIIISSYRIYILLCVTWVPFLAIARYLLRDSCHRRRRSLRRAAKLRESREYGATSHEQTHRHPNSPRASATGASSRAQHRPAVTQAQGRVTSHPVTGPLHAATSCHVPPCSPLILPEPLNGPVDRQSSGSSPQDVCSASSPGGRNQPRRSGRERRRAVHPLDLPRIEDSPHACAHVPTSPRHQGTDPASPRPVDSNRPESAWPMHAPPHGGAHAHDHEQQQRRPVRELFPSNLDERAGGKAVRGRPSPRGHVEREDWV